MSRAVLALPGGYARDESYALLARDPSMIASFSRALLEDPSAQQSDEEFHRRLPASIAPISAASVDEAVADRQEAQQWRSTGAIRRRRLRGPWTSGSMRR